MASSPIFQAAVSFVLAAGLSVWVALQGPLTPVHRILLGILAGMLAWDAGIVIAVGGADESGPWRAGLHLVYLAAWTIPALYLLLAARVGRVPLVEERPKLALAALLVPGLICFAAWFTNPLHGLARSYTGPEFFSDPGAGAGPLYWVGVTWGYLCVLVGIGLAIHQARRTRDPLERRQHQLLWLAALVPLIANLVYMARVLPMQYSPTPGAMTLTALILVVAIARYRFLESSPLPARDVIEHMRDGLLLADTRGRITHVNAAAEALLEGDAEHLVGRTLEEVAREIDPNGGLASHLSSEPFQPPGVGSVETLAGRFLEASTGWVGNRSGSALGRFLMLRDRTEQRRYERLRQRTERLQGLAVLAAGIAHEINNPLAFVRANLSHLCEIAGELGERVERSDAKRAGELTEMQEVLEESLSGLDRIAAIVTSTRRLTRAPEAPLEPVDLNEIVRRSIQLADWHPTRGAPVQTALAPALPPVTGASERLGQVLLNLLVNARQALDGSPEGCIRVETTREDQGVVVSVADNGPGVPEDLRPRIFDPFFTTKAPDEGTGLGLAIAFDIVREHAGTIELESPPSGGARFVVRLPAARG